MLKPYKFLVQAVLQETDEEGNVTSRRPPPGTQPLGGLALRRTAHGRGGVRRTVVSSPRSSTLAGWAVGSLTRFGLG